jgi:hypothetical protein
VKNGDGIERGRGEEKRVVKRHEEDRTCFYQIPLRALSEILAALLRVCCSSMGRSTGDISLLCMYMIMCCTGFQLWVCMLDAVYLLRLKIFIRLVSNIVLTRSSFLALFTGRIFPVISVELYP